MKRIATRDLSADRVASFARLLLVRCAHHAESDAGQRPILPAIRMMSSNGLPSPFMSSIDARPPAAPARCAPLRRLRATLRACRRAHRRSERPARQSVRSARSTQRRRPFASPCSRRPASPPSAASFSVGPGSSPVLVAAFCATVRLTSLEPKICPSTSFPRFTLVGCGASTSSSSPPPPSLPRRPPRPSSPRGL